MNPLEKYIASCSPEITRILDTYTYLTSRRVEEEDHRIDRYIDVDVDDPPVTNNEGIKRKRRSKRSGNS